jgi:hypothetical protein
MDSNNDEINLSIDLICCEIINKLLLSLKCDLKPINSLYNKRFRDGSVFVALIEKFENAFNEKIDNKSKGNYCFIENWFTKYGIQLHNNRTVAELLATDRLTYLALICYVVISVFLKYNTYIGRRIPGYVFSVDLKQLMLIVKFSKWKLCEEELRIVDKQLIKQREQIRALKIENEALRSTSIGLMNEIEKQKYLV